MPAIPTYLVNFQMVMDLYTRWPSFHDANVLDYQPPNPANASLSFTLHTWEMTSEVDGKGFFVLRKHVLVSFRFDDVYDLEMDAFGGSNIHYGLQFSPRENLASFRVELESVMDRSGSFSARRGKVLSVTPCSPQGKIVA